MCVTQYIHAPASANSQAPSAIRDAGATGTTCAACSARAGAERGGSGVRSDAKIPAPINSAINPYDIGQPRYCAKMRMSASVTSNATR